MERWMDRLRGQLTVRAEGARTEELLNLCAKHGIAFWGVRRENTLVIRFTVQTKDAKSVLSLAKRCGCEIVKCGEAGLPKRLRFLRRRAVLCICMVLALGMLFWSSLYVWDLEVRGNESVKTGEILNALEECGVGIGSFWPAFTSDSIRSRVLAELPELRWITVNINGSSAEVIVRERTKVPALYEETAYADIAASCGGVVEEVLALNGVALVKKGDTVSAGDVLISGMAENLMEQTRYLHALGTVRARTWHTLTAVCPLHPTEKGETEAAASRISVGLGEELLKIYPNSGILPANCGKITKEYVFGIPGVFTLPLSLRLEQLARYAPETGSLQKDAASEHLMGVLLEELSLRIGEEGEILSHSFTANEKDGYLFLKLEAECLQEIGETVPRTP